MEFEQCLEFISGFRWSCAISVSSVTSNVENETILNGALSRQYAGFPVAMILH